MVRKEIIFLALLVLIVIPTNVHAASSILTYGPAGTITTPYPTITALVHTFNAFVLLNETTMFLGTQKLNYTSSLANIIPGDSSWTSDITLSYTVQKWLVEGNYTVRVDVKIFDMSTHAKTTLTKQWWFIVAYDVATKMMFALNSTVMLMNSTLAGIRRDYTTITTTIGEWIPTLQALNNTMHYWNSTMQAWSNMASNINAMFSSTGTVGVFMTDVRNYLEWGFGILGLLVVIFSAVLAVLILRRTRSYREAPPPIVSRSYPSAPYPAQPQPSYPPPPPPQVSVRQPSSTMPPPAGGQIVCPSCGQQNRQHAIYCSNCRTRLAPEEAQAS